MRILRSSSLALWFLCPLLAAAPLPWNRVAPLDQNPALDSHFPLGRACAPGEAVISRVIRSRRGSDSPGLQIGQFLTCIRNQGETLIAVDGPGMEWNLRRNEVSMTRGFPRAWNACDRPVLVWNYAPGTILFRENICGSFEGNFLYLLLGSHKALLIDSGTGYYDLKPYVLPIVGDRELIVVSTHNHWDHFGGHRHFIGKAVLVGHQPPKVYDPYAPYDLDGLKKFFNLHNWPDENAAFDLGQRPVTIIPVPGHTVDTIALFDAKEHLLFTSDTVTPGMLFVDDWDHAVESVAKLARFAKAHHVKWVLGAHIEMSEKRESGRYEYFFYGRLNHFGEHRIELDPKLLPKVVKLLADTKARSPKAPPQYDVSQVERAFHELPFLPIPTTGLAHYYDDNTNRLLDELRKRFAKYDAGMEP